MAIDVSMWQQRVGAAIDFQANEHPKWREIIRFHKTEFLSRTGHRITTSEMSEMNFLYAYEKIKTGVVYARNPHIFCRALSTKFAPFADVMEQTINYYWRELKMKQKIKQCVRHSVLIPPGWIEVGYTGKIERPGGFDTFNELTAPVKTEGQEGTFDETIKRDDVFAKFRSPWEVVFPEGYHEIRETPYLIRIEEIPVIDLYANPAYNNNKYKIPLSQASVRIKKPTKFTMNANLPLSNELSADNETQKVTLYHIWDKRSNRRFTIAQGYTDNTLFERDWTYYIEGFTLFPLIFNEVPRTDTDVNSYPMSDAAPMLPQLRDLALFNTAMMRHGKRGGAVVIARKGALPPEDKANLMSSDAVDLIELESVSPDVLQTFTMPSVPGDWYKLRDVIEKNLMMISGYQQLLAQARGIETATESENLMAGQIIRQSESVDVMEDFTVDVARALAGLIWQFKDRQFISQIIGEPATQEMWPDLPQDEDLAKWVIQKELQFRIDAGSTRPPKDEAVERKQWIDSAAALKASFPSVINDAEMAKQVAKKTGFKDLERLVRGNEDQEIQVAQKENELLMRGVEQLVSPNENHQLHLQVHGQVYQVGGMQVPPEFDDHVMQHANYYRQALPTVSPQRGDTKPPMLSTMPELNRAGTPDFVDLVGGVKNLGGRRGTGANV